MMTAASHDDSCESQAQQVVNHGSKNSIFISSDKMSLLSWHAVVFVVGVSIIQNCNFFFRRIKTT
jgi:hypothetical protein